MKLYVGNLPYDTKDSDLNDLFAAYGTPQSVNVVMDRITGRSRGFAFVEFEDAEQAKAAMEALNGTQLGGRTLVVNEARSDGARTGGRGPRGGGFGGGRDSRGGGFGGGRDNRGGGRGGY